MPFTHVGGVAGKSGTLAMQQKIGKLRKRIAELEQVVVERNRCIKQLKAENAKLRELTKDACTVLRNRYNKEWFDGTVFAERMRELRVEVFE